MFKLKDLTVDGFNPDFIQLTWEFESIDSGNFSIEIYRSESPSLKLSDYEKIALVNLDTYLYNDTSFQNIKDLTRNWYYKLVVLNLDNMDRTDLCSDKLYYQNSKIIDRVSLRIIYLKKLILSRYSQRTFYLLKRRTWGIHCDLCWDATLQRSTDSNCPKCHGTGWVDGYFNSIPFMGQSSSKIDQNQLTQFGLWKPGNQILKTLNNPPIKTQDVIVDDVGKRWRVVEVSAIEKLGHVLEQQINITLIDTKDPVYQIQIQKFEDYTSVLKV